METLLFPIIGLTITCFSTIVCGVVWGIRLEGQVKTGRELAVQQDLFSDKRYVDITERFNRTDDTLEKLNEKLDRALESRRR